VLGHSKDWSKGAANGKNNIFQSGIRLLFPVLVGLEILLAE